MGSLVKVNPVIDLSVRELCCQPYHGHPKGCPNYGTRSTCPPQAPLLEEVIDLDKPVYVMFNVFPFGEWVKKMRDAHPKWSDRQCANCLYWQPKARKQLRERVEHAMEGYSEGAWKVLYVPEACGVNVTATMESIGRKLQWPPKTVTYQVALIGRPI